MDVSRIPDPDATKPEDWDEDAPYEILDEDAEKPEGWLVDEPLNIPDPGAWFSVWCLSHVHVPHPRCRQARRVGRRGRWRLDCPDSSQPQMRRGPWLWRVEAVSIFLLTLLLFPLILLFFSPYKPNPAYKGKWFAPMIDNPEYKGVWAPRKIPNPDHFEDLTPVKSLNKIVRLSWPLVFLGSPICEGRSWYRALDHD